MSEPIQFGTCYDDDFAHNWPFVYFDGAAEDVGRDMAERKGIEHLEADLVRADVALDAVPVGAHYGQLGGVDVLAFVWEVKAEEVLQFGPNGIEHLGTTYKKGLIVVAGCDADVARAARKYAAKVECL